MMISTNVGRSRRHARLVLLSLTTTLASGLATSAMAQDLPDQPLPPESQVFDRNDVDLSRGTVRAPELQISIGSSASGLDYDTFNQKYNIGIYVDITNSNDRDIIIGNHIIKFINSSGAYVSDRGDGDTLTFSGSTYTLTRRNGEKILFDMSPFGTGQDRNYYQTAKVQGAATQIIKPSGEIITFHYSQTSRTIGGGRAGSHITSYVRVQSVTSSSGYQIKFNYLSNTSTSAIADWVNMTKSTAINNAVDYCDPSADACGAFTQTWPSLSFSTTITVPITSTVTDTLGRATTYTYDSSGRLASVKRPASASADRTISYDSNGRVSSIVNDGLTWGYAFSLSGTTMTATVTNPDGGQRVIVSDSSLGLPTSSRDELFHTTTYAYDTTARLLTATFPEGNSVTHTYDGRGNIILDTFHAKPGSGLGDITTSAVYPSTCSNPLTCNEPTSTTDAHGNVTSYTYDPTHGGVLSATRPTVGGVAPQVRYTYTALQAYYKNASGSIVASGVSTYKLTGTSQCQTTASCVGVTDEVKTVISYGSPGVANNLLKTSFLKESGNGALSATTTLGYDAIGNMITVDGPLPGSADTTTYRYDVDRERVGVIAPDPDGAGSLKQRALRVSYSSDGMPTVLEVGTVTGTTDAAWAAFTSLQQLTATYDAADRKSSEILTSGGVQYRVSQYGYDAAGRLQCSALRMNSAAWGALPTSACTLGTTGSAGPDRIRKITYDLAGQTTVVQTAFGTADQASEASSVFSNNGKVAALTDAQGNTTTYQYDGFDRLVKTLYPNTLAGSGTSSTTDYEQLIYDATGNLTSRRLRGYASDSTRHIDYSYDALNRMILKDLPGTEPDISYAYDNLDRLTAAVDTGSNYVGYAYDALGRKTAESSSLGVIGMGYDLAGRRTLTVWPDGFYVNYDRSVTGEVTAVRENGATSGIGVLASFSYDDLGRRTGITRGNGATTSYSFDSVSRLTSLSQDLAGTGNDLTLGLSYNPANQLTGAVRSNDSYAWTAAIDRNDASTVNGLNQITSVGAGSIGYDLRGNLASSGSNSYTYSSENLLLTGPGATASYDPMMRLFETTAATASFYAYDSGQRVAEYNSSGTLLRRYVFGPDDDSPLVWYEGSGTSDRRWLHADERHSVIAVTNGSGVLIGTNTYDEYGVPGNSNIGAFQYTGQTWLPDFGVYYYKSRMYSSRIGRFLQTDPIGYSDGPNWYNYVAGDPINKVDPTGLDGDDNNTKSSNSDEDEGDIVVTASSDDGGGGDSGYDGGDIVVTASSDGGDGGGDIIVTATRDDGNMVDTGSDLPGDGDQTSSSSGSTVKLQPHVQPNHVQNKQARDARKVAERQAGKKMSKSQQRDFHDRVTGDDLSFEDLIEIAEDIMDLGGVIEGE